MMLAMPTWKELAIGAAIESCLLILLYFSRLEAFLVFLGFPGVLLQLALGSNIHDDRFFWLGVFLSWVFWSFVFGWLVWRVKRSLKGWQNGRSASARKG
jgi:hypothetical protein